MLQLRDRGGLEALKGESLGLHRQADLDNRLYEDMLDQQNSLPYVPPPRNSPLIFPSYVYPLLKNTLPHAHLSRPSWH